MPEILTVEQAAALLHVAPNTIYEAIRRGDLPHLRLGRTIASVEINYWRRSSEPS